MKAISQLIQEEEIQRRDRLVSKCSEQLEAAIRAGDRLGACIFVVTLLNTELRQSQRIVDDVRNGMDFFNAYNKVYDIYLYE